LTGLWNVAQKLLGDWVSHWISLSVFGLNELTIDEVFVNSGEGISLESGQEGH
jgi:hypothetical protein